MLKLGLLTCALHKNLTLADQNLAALLKARAFDVEPIVWDENEIDWSIYDALIFRTTWDYFEKEVAFLDWLSRMSKLDISIFNSIPLIMQNVHKFYLKDLESRGVSVVPTIYIEKSNNFILAEYIPESWDRIIIKPAFSAASFLTTLFCKNEIEEVQIQYQNIAREKDLLLQKFMPEIESNGECSLLFFNGRFSHAVKKLPKKGDFRVQSQYGGIYSPYDPNAAIIRQASNIVELQSETPLYARVDGIIIDDQLFLMELEMIEPDLYLDYHEEGYISFVNAIMERLHKS